MVGAIAAVPVWLEYLSLALQGAPTVISEVEAAINDHWGKDHTQQVVKGAAYLSQIASTVANVASQQATNVATPPVPGAQGPTDTGGHGPAGEQDPNAGATC